MDNKSLHYWLWMLLISVVSMPFIGTTVSFAAPAEAKQFVVFDYIDADIYISDVTANSTVRLTNDGFRNSAPHLSNDGSTIVFTSNRSPSGRVNIFTMDVNGSNVFQVTDCVNGCSAGSWSLDDQKIIYAKAQQPPLAQSGSGENLNIYLIDKDGQNDTRLTTASGVNQSKPGFAADGNSIYFVSGAQFSTLSARLFSLDFPALNNQAQLSVDQAQACWLSPDGTKFVCDAVLTLSDHDISVLDASGNLLHIIDHDYTELPKGWTPDGEEIVYLDVRDSNVYAMRIDGTNRRYLYSPSGDGVFSAPNDLSYFEPNRIFNLQWPSVAGATAYEIQGSDTGSITGNEAINTRTNAAFSTSLQGSYSTANPYLFRWRSISGGEASAWSFPIRILTAQSSVVFDYIDGEIYHTDLATNNTQQLTDDGFKNTVPHLSQDGSKVVFTSDRSSGIKNIFTMDADGRNIFQVTDCVHGCVSPSWSPDGDQIIYSKAHASSVENLNIYLIDADGSNNQRLTNDSSVNQDGAGFFLNKTKIFFASGSRGSTASNRVFVMDFPSLNNVTQLFPEQAQTCELSFAGDKLVCNHLNASKELELLILDLQGNELGRIDSGNRPLVKGWNLDGSAILFVDQANLTINLINTDGSGSLVLFPASARAFFTLAGVDLSPETDLTFSLVLGDVDGDGDIDLIVGNLRRNKLYLNDGSGGFDAVGTALGTESDRTFSLVLSDIDNDGDLDLFTGNDGQTNKLYFNDGSGGFSSTGIDIGTETDRTFSVVLGDVDADGDLDLVVGNAFATNKFYLNDGSGGFSATGTSVGSETDTTQTIVLGDVDGDGDLDLLTGSINGAPTRLYFNNGSGQFDINGTVVGPDSDDTYSLALGDVDNDGDLDLIAGNNGQTNKVYFNDGSGNVDTTGTAIGSETDQTWSIALRDLDKDGDLDLVAANDEQTNKYYLNDGVGAFDVNGTEVGAESDPSVSIAIGDVNGDGELDLVAGDASSSQTSKLYLNQSLAVTDIQQPVIRLLGNAASTHFIDTSFNDSGATACDHVDGDVSANIQVSGNVDTSTLGAYTLSYNVSDAAGNAATTVTRTVQVISDSLNDALVAHYSLNGNALDASPNGHNGVVQGNVQLVSDRNGVAGGAYNFDGLDSHIALGTSMNIRGAMTISVWVKPDAPVELTPFVAKFQDSSGSDIDDVYELGIADDGRAYFNVKDGKGDANSTSILSSDALVVGDWSHVLGRFNPVANTMEIFVNGVQVALRNSAVAGMANLPLIRTMIGARPAQNVDGYKSLYKGSIDELRIYQRALTNDEVLLLSSDINTLATQQVAGLNSAISVAQQTSFTTTAVYTVSDHNTSLSGLGVRIHFDSSVLTWDEFTNVLATSKIAQNLQPVADLENYDNDSNTDQYLAVAWASLAADWPGSEPINLFDIQFTTKAGFATDALTRLRFSSDNTAAGYQFLSAPVTVVSDHTKPVISLLGTNNVVVNLDASFTDPGATASDNVDGDISANIQVSGSVNTQMLGVYSLNYTVGDAAGNVAITVTRTVTVVDPVPPVVTAPANITAAATNASGTAASDPAIINFLKAATALDNVDGTIASIVNNAPPIFPLNVVTIVTFSATDNAGNTGAAQATVNITDQTAPVIILIGSNAITVDSGANFTDPGASASDNVDGDISATIQVSGSVNTSVIGDYALTYNVSDTANNIALSVTRNVTVRDNEPPVVTPPGDTIVPALDANGTPASDADIVNFLGAATAIDNVDGVIATLSNDAPLLFPVGVTLVTFTATDAAGNASTAQASVTSSNLPKQEVAGKRSSIGVVPGSNFAATAVYSVSDEDASLSGLGVRIHFDSRALNWEAFDNVLATSKIGQDVQPVADVENYDNDINTDQYLTVAWASLGADWPGSEPIDLFDIRFTVDTSFVTDSVTTLRFTSGNTAAGYQFVGAPIEVVSALSLDVDDDAGVTALTDGLLIIRYLFGFTDSALTDGAVNFLSCKRCGSAEILAYLEQLDNVLDVDGNDQRRALTDGILILRQLFGFSGEGLIGGVVGSNCTRCGADEISQYIELIREGAAPQGPLTVNAGADSSATAADNVSLLGSSDGGSGTVALVWVQTDGPLLNLSSAQTSLATLSFTAPQVLVDTLFTFSLTATDASGAIADEVVLTVSPRNPDPVASAGPDRTGATTTDTNNPQTSQIIFIDGSQNSGLQAVWSIQSSPIGSTTGLTSASTPSTGFFANLEGDYVLKLTVSNGQGLSVEDFVTITLVGDADGDGLSNADDADRDGDGFLNITDLFPDDITGHLDADSDGISNYLETDVDDDGVDDVDDDFPLDATQSVFNLFVESLEDLSFNQNDGISISENAGTAPLVITGKVLSNPGAPDLDFFRVTWAAGVYSIVVSSAAVDFSPSLSVLDASGRALPTSQLRFLNQPGRAGIAIQVLNPGDFFLLIADSDGKSDDSYIYNAKIVEDLDMDGLANDFEQAIGSNHLTADSDGDSVTDFIEVQFAMLNSDPRADIDNDGIPAWWDSDSDGDTIPDNIEYATPVERPDLSVIELAAFNDIDADQSPNFVDTSSDGTTFATDIDQVGSNPLLPRDTDGDGIADFLDTDDDNDGLPDIEETLSTYLVRLLGPGAEGTNIADALLMNSLINSTVAVENLCREGETLTAELSNGPQDPVDLMAVFNTLDGAILQNPSTLADGTATFTCPGNIAPGLVEFYLATSSQRSDSKSLIVQDVDAPVISSLGFDSNTRLLSFTGINLDSTLIVNFPGLPVTIFNGGGDPASAQVNVPVGVDNGLVSVTATGKQSNELYLLVNRQISGQIDSPNSSVDVTLLDVALQLTQENFPAADGSFVTDVNDLNPTTLTALLELPGSTEDIPAYGLYLSAIVLPNDTSVVLDPQSTALALIWDGLGINEIVDVGALESTRTQLLALDEIIALSNLLSLKLQNNSAVISEGAADLNLALVNAIEAAAALVAPIVTAQLQVTGANLIAPSGLFGEDAQVTPAVIDDISVFETNDNSGNISLKNDTQLYLSAKITASDGQPLHPHITGLDGQAGPQGNGLLFWASTEEYDEPWGENATVEVITPGVGTKFDPKRLTGENLEVWKKLYIRTVVERIFLPILEKVLPLPETDAAEIIYNYAPDVVDIVVTKALQGEASESVLAFAKLLGNDFASVPPGPITQAIAKKLGKNFAKRQLAKLAAKIGAKFVPGIGQVKLAIEAVGAISTGANVGTALSDLKNTDAIMQFDVVFPLSVDEVLPSSVLPDGQSRVFQITGSGFSPIQRGFFPFRSFLKPLITVTDNDGNSIEIEAENISGDSTSMEIEIPGSFLNESISGPLSLDINHPNDDPFATIFVDPAIAIVDALELSSISPDTGGVGSQATLFGTGFSGITIENEVTIGGLSAVITGASDSALQLIIPSALTAGSHAVVARVLLENGSFSDLSNELQYTVEVGDVSLQVCDNGAAKDDAFALFVDGVFLGTVFTSPSDFCDTFNPVLSIGDHTARLLGVEAPDSIGTYSISFDGITNLSGDPLSGTDLTPGVQKFYTFTVPSPGATTSMFKAAPRRIPVWLTRPEG